MIPAISPIVLTTVVQVAPSQVQVTPQFAPLASPSFTGSPTAPTAAPGTNTVQIATTAFVHAAVGASAFSALSDVAVASPATGQYPRYNATDSKWHNSTIQLGDLGSGTPGAGNFLRGSGAWSAVALSDIAAGTLAVDLVLAAGHQVTTSGANTIINAPVGYVISLQSIGVEVCNVNPNGVQMDAGKYLHVAGNTSVLQICGGASNSVGSGAVIEARGCGNTTNPGYLNLYVGNVANALTQVWNVGATGQIAVFGASGNGSGGGTSGQYSWELGKYSDSTGVRLWSDNTYLRANVPAGATHQFWTAGVARAYFYYHSGYQDFTLFQTGDILRLVNDNGSAYLSVYGSGTLNPGAIVINPVSLGFFSSAPIAQPTTAVGSATRVSNAGNTVTDADTFDGYTIKQIVRLIRNLGLAA